MNDVPRDPAEHVRALRAASFGARARAYAEHRPDYPTEAVEWGLEPAGMVKRLLDLAAGTGKLAATLRAFGAVTAVEPDLDMLTQLRESLPDVAALKGTAEEIPLRNGSMDAVCIGQAFHWFDGEAALEDIARVLRPGGVVLLLWNDDDEVYPWVAEFAALMKSGGGRAYPHRLPSHEAFCPFQRDRFPHVQRRTAHSMVETLATHSHVLISSERERAALLRRARQILASRPQTARGEFDRPMVTTALRAVRR
ncbi:SAM-dependent methyltransferase [Saccharomonospora amisosensis]|uniref:SAM-dependent methyltransferase n=1 Tax=Saccharomonospora amisosensis TaxID=1128677 RepID=A0A7X5ZNV2_9PSEU|nr:class I SAM-dependent methyltransferase [Saccharomonospora amisosensis]NIJ10103.1 SAM-dependent methyltransferase [Saccharomonospora amisosensis]